MSGDAEDPREHRTLYVAGTSDPRERAAQAHERVRGRRANRAETTSDITRFRGMLFASGIGAGAMGITALVLPPESGLSGLSAPMALPHAEAELGCGACHGEHAPRSEAGRAAAQDACEDCHEEHPSTRAGHRAMVQDDRMRCTTCHTIHETQQGVRFYAREDDEQRDPTRYGPGWTTSVDVVDFSPERTVTVPIIVAGSCRGCHDAGDARDPVRRCLVPGLSALGPNQPVVCFDEHRQALPPDATDVRGKRASRRKRRRSRRDEDAVCADQHAPDRPLAWEAAREVAIAAAVAPPSRGGSGPWPWLGVGALAAGLAYASAMLRDTLRRRKTQRERRAAAEEVRPAANKRLPTVDTATCLGCYACVDACPYPVLEIQRYVAVVVRPEACCGLSLCEQRCPNGSLVVTDGEPIGDRPRLRSNLESSDVPGLYLAGDITGLPLIKNAIHQGARAMDEIASSLEADRASSRDTSLSDVLVVGAGPAGISAALRAKELGLTAVVIDEADVAQSIRSFPRGKLVFDQPLELPLRGKLWLQESTKEELLTHWLRIVRQEKLDIRPDTRMTGVSRESDGSFTVQTRPREGEGGDATFRAQRVLVCIGQRGTPRRLSVPLSPEVEARVHYHLADARSFEGQRVLVVGLGDVAMETAIALGRQAGTTVTLIHRGDTFARGNARNIEEVKRMREAARLTLLFNTEVTRLELQQAVLRSPGGQRNVEYDAVFVMIGNIPPWSTLHDCGVQLAGDAPGPRQEN